jgi:hypothetical protein
MFLIVRPSKGTRMETPGIRVDGEDFVVNAKLRYGMFALWVALFFAGLVSFLLLKKDSELPVYMVAAGRMARGEPIYRDEPRAFTYPPLFGLPFVPVALLPQAVQPTLWYLVNFAALLLILVRLQRRLQAVLVAAPGLRAPAVWMFWALVAVLASRHIVTILERRSHDLLVFLFAFLAVDAWCAGRSKAAGALAGLGAALKATPLLFAPIFLWQRRFPAFLCLVLALIAGLLLPDLFCPAQDGSLWIMSWYRTFLTSIQPGEAAASSAWMPWWELNQSVAGTVHRWFAHPGPRNGDLPDISVVLLDRTPMKIVTLACQLIVAAWLFWVTRPALTRHLRGEPLRFVQLGQGAMVLMAMVLLSPTSIKTHFCVLLAPIAFCLADFLYRRRDPFVGFALIVTLVLGTLTARELCPRKVADWTLVAGSITWSALALYAATGRIVLERARLARAESQGIDLLSLAGSQRLKLRERAA